MVVSFVKSSFCRRCIPETSWIDIGVKHVMTKSGTKSGCVSCWASYPKHLSFGWEAQQDTHPPPSWQVDSDIPSHHRVTVTALPLCICPTIGRMTFQDFTPPWASSTSLSLRERWWNGPAYAHRCEETVEQHDSVRHDWLYETCVYFNNTTDDFVRLLGVCQQALHLLTCSLIVDDVSCVLPTFSHAFAVDRSRTDDGHGAKYGGIRWWGMRKWRHGRPSSQRHSCRC
jgi:hypothetical protein